MDDQAPSPGVAGDLRPLPSRKREREFFVDNLLVWIYLTVVMNFCGPASRNGSLAPSPDKPACRPQRRLESGVVD